jgi:hypothetical protein
MSLLIPVGITELPDFFGSDCSEITSEIENNISEIGPNIFRGNTNLTTLDLRGCKNLISLCPMAVQGCSKINKIFLPSNLKNIGTCCFSNCSNY